MPVPRREVHEKEREGQSDEEHAEERAKGEGSEKRWGKKARRRGGGGGGGGDRVYTWRGCS